MYEVPDLCRQLTAHEQKVRLANARWIQPSEDERLTLITCWPYESNTHRLIIVALPASQKAIEDYVMVPRATPHPKAN